MAFRRPGLNPHKHESPEDRTRRHQEAVDRASAEPEAGTTSLPPTRLSADAAYYVEIITGLLKTGHYDWARETLEGIRSTIERTGNLTSGQRQAVDRTMAGRLKHDLGR